MTDEFIEHFNKSRSFLYLAGYLTDTENDKVKKRFTKEATAAGITLIKKPLMDMKL